MSSSDTQHATRPSDSPIGATCRICRGEATSHQPLFHPCKCKGSIKYIHESCLLEWLASKNISTSTTSSVNCDICHYPIQFKTMYDDNMPDKLPWMLLFWSSILSVLNSVKVWFTISLACLFLVAGIPLAWNCIRNLYIILLDGQLPIPNQFFKSLIYGYYELNDNSGSNSISKTFFNQDTNLIDLTYFFSIGIYNWTQIVLVIILLIALYFQYDMVVREPVFAKMIYHKIGPQYTKEELFKIQLKERFPMMDDESLNHIARLMRERDNVQAEQDANNNNNHDNLEQEHHEEEFENGPQQHNHRNDIEDLDEPMVQDVRENHIPNEFDETDLEDHDYDHQDAELDGTSSSANDSWDGTEHNIANELLSDHEDDAHFEMEQRQMEIEINRENRNAQRQFDDLLDRHVLENQNQNQNNNGMPLVINADVPQPPRNRPVIPEFIPPPELAQPQPQRPAPQNDQINADQQVLPPIVVNLRLKFSNILTYYLIACLSISLFLFITFFIPSVIGLILIQFYLFVINMLKNSIEFLLQFSTSKNLIYSNKLFINFRKNLYPHISPIFFEINEFKNNLFSNKLFLRSLPVIVAYSTIIFMIYISSNFISKGFNRDNGMKNARKRLIFQILFGIQCTLKVFVLFFIELLGFPILAGLLLDLSLFTPLFVNSFSYKTLWGSQFLIYWKPLVGFIYWGLGTMYMHWFAKFIGMIRQYIIRPGVLFFIRSPEDPNIKILQDSLIHPLKIQISRLALSFFIYAIFILVGFGSFTIVLFPIVLNLKFFEITKLISSNFLEIWLLTTFAFSANQFIDSKESIKHFIRLYWNYIFEISSKKLRLSSFLLGKDFQTERGHIIYRNLFYKFLNQSSAELSNQNLFTDPKIPAEAKELFRINPNVHAYFVPDGQLIRVPSSDIVSRNYVQTMFVPVTKDDKLLKPLDLDRIKMKNEKNSGTFGYLEDQTTEFDGYSIVYSPPSFRSRYITLIVLIWFFAAVLTISSALLSQITSTIILFALYLPTKLIFGATQLTNLLKFLIDDSLNHISLALICTGGIILAQTCDGVYKRYKEIERQNEHVHNEHENENMENAINHNHNANINDNNRNENEIADTFNEPQHKRFNFFEFVNVSIEETKELFFNIIESGIFKWHLFLVFLILTHAIGISTNFFNLLQGTVFGLGYISKRFYTEFREPLFRNWLNFSIFSKQSMNTIIVLPLTLRAFQTSLTFAHLYRINRNMPTKRLIVKFWNYLYETTLTTTIETAIPIIFCWVNFVLFEFYTNNDQYDNIPQVLLFFWDSRLSQDSNNIPWTIFQHLTYISTILILLRYIFINIYAFISNWFGTAVQSVKDEIYAKGKALENFPDNENENDSQNENEIKVIPETTD
ncbi:hypothetical protein TBLA_0D04640 [Henningerozyma blattae CBS 6284]|uniref:RING-type E3 ubiquitin transferase n=1 Tax=Henningerozyma blattae (strain ATCC 34711 / CBS 6284 / DSM 70876 / NBRC 10599 / NRRL Y-10934 / UCD 77-7) TaxID=1071380 RepID=I2H3K8_HENB6|nr:hypothetical protein TBLA_0D04640 [Tetrapisispora blattae CBS 6284]CCH60960.1 hypothetical protein TBLA_0D04640 [Tetrapisispora blattae CBS 6284]